MPADCEPTALPSELHPRVYDRGDIHCAADQQSASSFPSFSAEFDFRWAQFGVEFCFAKKRNRANKKPAGGIEPPIYRLRSGCLATWPYRLSVQVRVVHASNTLEVASSILASNIFFKRLLLHPKNKSPWNKNEHEAKHKSTDTNFVFFTQTKIILDGN